MSERFRIKGLHVPCPECGAKTTNHYAGQRAERCVSPTGGTYTHKARLALARRISTLLRCHFDIVIKPCTGEAHRPEVGGMIDHCMVCAPRWGDVEVLVPRRFS
jgi:hypothetical protein